ncbi:MAG: hypothetical protein ACYC1Z_03380 [Georgenia sp.]
MGYCGPRGLALSTFLSWPQEDQDAALAWQGHESRRCSSCGFHPDDGGVHSHIDVCPGCVALEHARKDASKINGSHVRIAHGTAATCDRCRREAAANAH